MIAIVDGEAVDGPPTLHATDPMVTRGDGCFEAVKSYRGALFALDEHLLRLERSAAALDIVLPPRDDIAGWARTVAAQRRDDSMVRILVSAGDGSGTTVIVFGYDCPDILPTYRLATVAAPWHPAGEPWELAGVKTLSYAPNMGAQRVATADGFDDALLIGRGGEILELPTGSIAWVVDGVVETPKLDLGILDSISRQVLLAVAERIGRDVVTGVWGVERLDEATETMVLSTTKEIAPVSAIDDRRYASGGVTAELATAFRAEVIRRVGSG